MAEFVKQVDANREALRKCLKDIGMDPVGCLSVEVSRNVELAKKYVQPGGILDYKLVDTAEGAAGPPEGGGVGGGNVGGGRGVFFASSSTTDGGGGAGTSRKCPTNCAGTVTMCGKCLDNQVPGNFGYGFALETIGFGDLASPYSNYLNKKETGRDDSPADKASIAKGREAAKEWSQRNKDKKEGKGKKDGKSDKDALKDIVCKKIGELVSSEPSTEHQCEVC